MALVQYTQGRIQSAQDQFSGALGDVRADITAESDAELSPLVGIILGAVAATASIAIQAGIKALASLRTAEEVLGHAAITGVAVAGEMSDVSEGEIEAIVGASIDQAKELVKPGVSQATRNTKTNKDNKKSFLDELNNQTVLAFFHLREDPPAYATDAQLLALCEGYHPNFHHRDVYREQLERRLKRFMSTLASQIGRRDAPGDEGFYGMQRETKVAWLKGTSHNKLIYVSQDFNMSQDELTDRASAYTTAPMESYGDVAHDNDAMAMEGGYAVTHQLTPEERVMFLGDVEPDMVEAAIARHKALWLEDPKTYTYAMLMFGGSPKNEVAGKGAR